MREQVQLRHALPEEPLSEEVGVLVVAIRLPDGKRLKRMWRKTDRIRNVYNWVNSSPSLLFLKPSLTQYLFMSVLMLGFSVYELNIGM